MARSRARQPLLAGAAATLVLVALLVVVELRSSGPRDEGRAHGRESAAGAAAGDSEDGAGGGGDAAGAERDGPVGDLVLAFAGEVHLEGALDDLADRPGSTLGELTPALRRADLAVLNLESAVTDGSSQPASKELEDPSARYWFGAPPSVFGLLERSGVDVVSMANNHGADYGAAGLRLALDAAADSPVGLVGVGRGVDRAYAPYRTRIEGTDVAVLAADASPRESADATWAVAEGTGPGIAAARRPDPARLLAAVRSAAEADDVVVVYLHWGEEGNARATAAQRRLAGQLAEAGADVVVGSHAHVLQGSGMLGDTYVSYGLGNFAWYHGRQSETGVLQVRLRDGRVVGDSWQPGRIPPQGGTPDRVDGPARPAAVAAWRDLRRGTGLEPTPRAPRTPQPAAYVGTVARLSPQLRAQMRGSSHAPGCPVPLDRLRLLRMSYVGFDQEARVGRMVVHRDVADEVVAAFEELYDARFPIRRMRLIDAYDGDDDASMAADNTSGYNCRRVAGSSSWSDHAYGRAIDINPVENPYVRPGSVEPPAGRRFVDVDRSSGSSAAPGVISRGDVVLRAFTGRGWEWGGAWSSPDYQHLSAP